MKRVRVIDTSGAALDWLVAKAAERLDQRVQPDPRPGTSAIDIGLHEGKVLVFDRDKFDYVPFRPSTDWAQGGPIMEREKISPREERPGLVLAPYFNGVAHVGHKPGPTYLIAGMRCYVASKLGDEVEVQEELL